MAEWLLASVRLRELARLAPRRLGLRRLALRRLALARTSASGRRSQPGSPTSNESLRSSLSAAAGADGQGHLGCPMVALASAAEPAVAFPAIARAGDDRGARRANALPLERRTSGRPWVAVLLASLLAVAFALTVDAAAAQASPGLDGRPGGDAAHAHGPVPGVAGLASVTLPGQDDRFVGLWLPFGFLGLIAWSVWLVRRALTAFYRPIANDHSEAASVVAPAFREDPVVLERAVRSWLATGVSEVLLVLTDDEPENVARARAAFHDDPQVRILTTDDPAKRNSLTIGIGAATQPIVVLSDSDTLWEPDLLRNLLMPFADPRVGGVGTRQRVLDPRSSVWRRGAGWVLDASLVGYSQGGLHAHHTKYPHRVCQG